MKLQNQTIQFNSGIKVQLKDPIYNGHYSTIFLTDNDIYVAKVIEINDQIAYQEYRNEKYTYSLLQDHQNIVFCKGFKEISQKEHKVGILLLERCPKGSLVEVISLYNDTALSEELIFQIIYQLANGLKELHSRGITHRSLKLENCLIGKSKKVKICDFGSISTQKIEGFDDNQRKEIVQDIERATSLNYRAPELCDIQKNIVIGEKADIWSLGVILYLLCYQRFPFKSEQDILDRKYFKPDYPHYSEKIEMLLSLMLQVQPKERISAEQVVDYIKYQFQNIGQSQITGNEGDRKLSELNLVPDYENLDNFKQDLISYQEQKKEKHKFRSKMSKIFKMQNGTESWVASCIEEKDEGPKQKYVRFLIIKAWQKKHKINKFYQCLNKQWQKSNENTMVGLKTLLLLHNYLKKGPQETVSLLNREISPLDILNSIQSQWIKIKKKKFGLVRSDENKLKKEKKDSKGKKDSEFLTDLIIQYSAVLIQKVKLLLDKANYIEGNYSLQPFFNNSRDKQVSLNPGFIEDLLKFLQLLSDFNKIQFQEQSFSKLQISMIMSMIDEEYCLISVLSHLIYSFKKSTNYYIPGRVNREKLLEKIKQIDRNFDKCYDSISEFFSKCQKMKDFSETKDMIPVLYPEALNVLDNIEILQNKPDDNFNLFEYLNYQRNIFNLKIPNSYGQAILAFQYENQIKTDSILRTDFTTNFNFSQFERSESQASVQQDSKQVTQEENELQKDFQSKNPLEKYEVSGEFQTKDKVIIVQEQNMKDINNFLSDKEKSIQSNQSKKDVQSKEEQLISKEGSTQQNQEPSSLEKQVKLNDDRDIEQKQEEFIGKDQDINQKQEEIEQNEEKKQQKVVADSEFSNQQNQFELEKIRENHEKIDPYEFHLPQNMKNDLSNQEVINSQDPQFDQNHLPKDQNIQANQQLDLQEILQKLNQNQKQKNEIVKFTYQNQNHQVNDNSKITQIINEQKIICQENEQSIGQQYKLENVTITKTKYVYENDQIGKVVIQERSESIQKKDCHYEEHKVTDIYKEISQRVSKHNSKKSSKENSKKTSKDNSKRNSRENSKKSSKKSSRKSSKSSNSYKDIDLDETNGEILDNMTQSQILRKFIEKEVVNQPSSSIIQYNQLKFYEQVGSGSSSEVFKGEHQGCYVAIKKIKTKMIQESTRIEFERELTTLKKIRPHPNLVQFVGVACQENDFCILTEFCEGGTLFDLLHRKKNIPLTWAQRLRFCKDIALGMNFLHKENPPIIHRDLKSLNLLLDRNPTFPNQRVNVKVADFGLARTYSLSIEKMTGMMGTFHWMAPEIFENREYSIKADIFSYGIVLWEIASRQTPYRGLKGPHAIMKYVTVDQGRPDLSQVHETCPKQLIDLMQICWDIDPNIRPSFDEILQKLHEIADIY